MRQVGLSWATGVGLFLLSVLSLNLLAAVPSAAQIELLQQLSADDLARLEQVVKDKQTVIPVPAVPDPVNVPAVVPRDPYSKKETLTSGLKPFGYDLFAGDPTTFFPASDIPVAVDYVIGPGDVIEVQLFGNTNASYSLRVNRRGVITFPSVGTINVAGMSFDDMRSLLKERVTQQFIGVEASITLGELRAMRVFVLGEVQRPGSYVVNAMSTMTNALFVSGGITLIGSLRDIQLKRDGKLISSMDLYDLLLSGDTHSDLRLQPGDVIFVPSIGTTVAIEGEVRRPASYELSGEQTLGDMLDLVGGLNPDAYPSEVRLERIDARRQRVLMDIDLTQQSGLKTLLQDGDRVHVYSLLEKLENVVTLEGHVQRRLAYQWRAGLRLSAVVPDVGQLRTDTDLDYLIIQRQQPDGKGIHLLSASLRAALDSPGSDTDVLLQADDRIILFSLEYVSASDARMTENNAETSRGSERQAVLRPLLNKVRELATREHPAGIVGIGGKVRFPGDYPLDQGMRLSDLIRASGYLRESAYPLEAEMTRQQIDDDQVRNTEHIDINLAEILAGESDDDLQLLPNDVVIIKEIPQWRDHEYMEIVGEVMFPGRYSISQGETLVDLIERAGGLTAQAFAKGAVFSRVQLQQRERAHMQRMANNLEQELAGFGLQQAQMQPEQQQAYQFAQQLVSRLRETEAIGRLVVDLDRLMTNPEASSNLYVVDGDRLFIPPQRDEVTVIGEVFFPTSHIFKDGMKCKDYIKNSGGFTANADAKRSYVIHANGAVEPLGGGFWSRSPLVSAGDTIVVPLNADRVNPVRLWTDVTQILYQLSLAAASMKTLGVF